MADTLVFANPIAGRGLGRTLAQATTHRLLNEGLPSRLFLERPDEVPEAAVGERPRAVVVIGGDGTVRSAAERMLRAFPRDPPPMLIVPMGTANLLGRHLGIRWNMRDVGAAVVSAIRKGGMLQLDAAQANGRLFVLMAGVGLDARIVHDLERLRKGPIDVGSYMVPAALALGQYHFPPLRVTVDGRPLGREAPAVVFVGNVKEYGTGFPMLPHARPDDGLLDVCVLPCAGRGEALRLFLMAAAGEHLEAEGAAYAKGRQVRIESSRAVPVQVDGDAAGYTPVEIGLLPVRLPFIVP